MLRKKRYALLGIAFIAVLAMMITFVVQTNSTSQARNVANSTQKTLPAKVVYDEIRDIINTELDKLM